MGLDPPPIVLSLFSALRFCPPAESVGETLVGVIWVLLLDNPTVWRAEYSFCKSNLLSTATRLPSVLKAVVFARSMPVALSPSDSTVRRLVMPRSQFAAGTHSKSKTRA